MYGDLDDLAAFTSTSQNTVPLILNRSEISGEKR